MNQTGLFSDVAFFTTVAAEGDLPSSSRIEVAFAGRSNAGKSSAINALAQRNRLAFVSKTPGRTQHMNFFSLGGDRFLVDLPGYGYAKVPRAMRVYWEALISAYLQTRAQLQGLVVVMDIRHPLTPLDLQLLDWFAATGKPAHVLLTKADKISRQQGITQLRSVGKVLSANYPRCSAQLFSAAAKVGIEEAEALLDKWLA